MTKISAFTVLRTLVDDYCATADKADLLDFLDKQIELLENRSVKAKERAAAKAVEADLLYDAVLAAMKQADEALVPEEICEMIEADDLSAAMVRARCIKAVKNGLAVKTEKTLHERTYVAYAAV